MHHSRKGVELHWPVEAERCSRRLGFAWAGDARSSPVTFATRLTIERLTGDLAAAGGVRAVILADGSERGIRVLEFRTGGGLRFDVLVYRAMDIGLAEFDDLSVGWRSATGFRHTALHEHSDEEGLSWLRSMSGLVVTAGLDHTLFGETVDAEQYHYPARQ